MRIHEWLRPVKDWVTIVGRLHWLWTRRYQFDPLPWARCHCGALAEIDLGHGGWCMPCKYAGHDTCECSNEGDRS